MKSPVYRKNTDFAPGEKVICLSPGDLDFREDEADHDTVVRLSENNYVVIQSRYTEVFIGAHLLKKVSEIDGSMN